MLIQNPHRAQRTSSDTSTFLERKSTIKGRYMNLKMKEVDKVDVIKGDKVDPNATVYYFHIYHSLKSSHLYVYKSCMKEAHKILER